MGVMTTCWTLGVGLGARLERGHENAVLLNMAGDTFLFQLS